LTVETYDDSVVPDGYQSRFDRLIVEVLRFAGLAQSKSALSHVAAFFKSWDMDAVALYWSFGAEQVEDIPLHPIALLVILAFCLDVTTRGLVLQIFEGDRDSQRQVVRILEKAYRALEGRRLCLCEPGFPNCEDFSYPQGALVPPSAQIGDLICRVDGESRFLVLRAAEPVGTFIKEGATFEFVGICNFGLWSMKWAIQGTFVLQ
jgi:hypothetical protein